MDTSTLVGLRDRAVMAFTFARVSAVVGLKVEDYYAQKKRWWLRLREKNGKVNEMAAITKLESYLDAYIEAAGIAADRKRPLFRTAIWRTGRLSERPVVLYADLRAEIDASGLSLAQKNDAMGAIEIVQNQVASGKPNKSIVSAFCSTLCHKQQTSQPSFQLCYL